jgi:tetratricopeptide (TPR) repeat protein
LNNASGVCMRLGQPEEAVRLAEAALALRPDYADAHFNLNTALRCAGRHEEAVRRCWEVLLAAASASHDSTDGAGDGAGDSPGGGGGAAVCAAEGAGAGAGSSHGATTAIVVPPVAAPACRGAPPRVPSRDVPCPRSDAAAKAATEPCHRPVFVCVKWGRKYGPEYVNKLYAAVGGCEGGWRPARAGEWIIKLDCGAFRGLGALVGSDCPR